MHAVEERENVDSTEGEREKGRQYRRERKQTDSAEGQRALKTEKTHGEKKRVYSRVQRSRGLSIDRVEEDREK